MSSANDTNRRITDIITTYWSDLKGKGKIPFERDVDLGVLHELYGHSFMLEVRSIASGTWDYRYSFLGDSIDASVYDDSGGGKEVYSQLIAPNNQDLVHKLNRVSKTLGPVLEDSEFVNHRGVLIRYRRCFVPLAFQTGELGFIMGGINWRPYKVYAREDGKRFMSGKAICEDDFDGPPRATTRDEVEKAFSKIEGMSGEDDAWAHFVLEAMEEGD